jgi:hypothetical protein
MYYDTYRGFARRAEALGFRVSDSKEQSLAESATRQTGMRGGLMALLSRVGLLLPAYHAHRVAVVSTFEVTLQARTTRP